MDYLLTMNQDMYGEEEGDPGQGAEGVNGESTALAAQQNGLLNPDPNNNGDNRHDPSDAHTRPHAGVGQTKVPPADQVDGSGGDTDGGEDEKDNFLTFWEIVKSRRIAVQLAGQVGSCKKVNINK